MFILLETDFGVGGEELAEEVPEEGELSLADGAPHLGRKSSAACHLPA